MRKESYVFHRRLDYNYPMVTKGKGIFLYDNKGKSYIDAVCGAFTAILGHGLEDFSQEIKLMIEKISYLHGAQFTSRYLEEYAKELCKVFPFQKAYFVSSGSDAVETAIKLARQFHYASGNKDKYKIIFTQPGYHGATLGALSVSGRPALRKIYEPYLLKFPYIPACFCYHCYYKKRYPDCNLRCAFALEEIIERENPKTISSFIVEPIIVVSAGVAVPVRDYFSIIRRICEKYNILLIFDEITTGFGRTGKWFCGEHFGITPDILILGKGLCAGIFPLSCVLCKEAIYNKIKKTKENFIHGFTFVNHHLGAGIGLLVLEYIKNKNLLQNCLRKGEYLFSKISILNKESKIVGDIRGKGLLVGVELVKDKEKRIPFHRKLKLAERIVQKAMYYGLNLYFSLGFVDGIHGDAIIVAPPYNVTQRELSIIAEKLISIILETEKQLR